METVNITELINVRDWLRTQDSGFQMFLEIGESSKSGFHDFKTYTRNELIIKVSAVIDGKENYGGCVERIVKHHRKIFGYPLHPLQRKLLERMAGRNLSVDTVESVSKILREGVYYEVDKNWLNSIRATYGT